MSKAKSTALHENAPFLYAHSSAQYPIMFQWTLCPSMSKSQYDYTINENK